jgi:Zn-dependent protease
MDVSAFQNWLQQLNWQTLLDLAITAAAALLCITFHETCHGLAALWLGDPTAKRAKRLSLNPLRHVDWMGLVMLALVKFGWAKPVPVDPRYFKHPKLGMALTALAGPAGNVLLAWLGLVGYYAAAAAYVLTASSVHTAIAQFCVTLAIVSAGLAIFNLFPVPPLDGSKVLFSVLPDKTYFSLMRYERYGALLLIALLLTGVLSTPLVFLRNGLLELLDPAARWAYTLTLQIFS